MEVAWSGVVGVTYNNVKIILLDAGLGYVSQKRMYISSSVIALNKIWHHYKAQLDHQSNDRTWRLTLRLGTNQETNLGRCSWFCDFAANLFCSCILGAFWGVQATHAKKRLAICSTSLGKIARGMTAIDSMSYWRTGSLQRGSLFIWKIS